MLQKCFRPTPLVQQHPRGLVVTRFPETRQEGEKQNKPESRNSVRTPFHRKPCYFQERKLQEVQRSDRRMRGCRTSKQERFLAALGKLFCLVAVGSHRGAGLALKLAAACCYVSGFSWDEEGEAILTELRLKLHQDSQFAHEKKHK